MHTYLLLMLKLYFFSINYLAYTQRIIFEKLLFIIFKRQEPDSEMQKINIEFCKPDFCF